MKFTTPLAAAAAALLIGMPAMAACPDDINKLRDDLRNNQGFFQRYEAGQIDRAAYLRLFEAAQTFANNRMEERCQDVLAGIKELSEKRQAEDQQQRTAPPRADAPPADRSRADRPRADRPATPATPGTGAPRQDMTQDRQQRLRAAQPVNQVRMSAETLVGADVRNMEDRDLGDVSDVIMSNGQLSHIVVGRGGFLGIGVSYYMLPANQVKVALTTDDGRVARDRIVVVEMSAEQLEASPKVTKDNGIWTAQDGERRPPATAPGAPPERTPQQRTPQQQQQQRQ
jgi:hypothetical protein